MRNVTILLAVLAVVAMAVPAQAADKYWNATGEWTETSKWNPTGEPVTGDWIHIDSGTCTVKTVEGCGFVQITSGELVVETGANLVSSSNIFFSGTGATFTQTGGTFSTPINTAATIGSSAVNISGGSFRSAYTVLNTGAVFTVDGTPTAVKCTDFDLTAGATLGVILAADGGLTAVDASTYGVLSTVSGKLLVDSSKVGGGILVPNVTKITVLLGNSAANLDYTGLTLDAASSPDWELIADDGSQSSIQVQYVPEPATMVLLGIGGIGVLIRRKRR